MKYIKKEKLNRSPKKNLIEVLEMKVSISQIKNSVQRGFKLKTLNQVEDKISGCLKTITENI
jgi:hypothetical protein